ncbi:MAG: metallophosphoesterase [bacterium]|nr:metallophosphoesterase [bacterium]
MNRTPPSVKSADEAVGAHPVRLALVADIHYGQFSEAKAGPEALRLLEGVIDEVNSVSPDLVVDLGDRINEECLDRDAALFRKVSERFQKLRVPWRFLPGNHDLVHLSVAECETVLGQPLSHHSMDLRGCHLVFWHADPRQRPAGRAVERGDLDWLEADLRSTDLPAIIFTHIPFGGASVVGNYYFGHNPPGGAEYRNASGIRDVLGCTESAVLAIAGHVHWNTLTTIDGIRYVTIQSLTETFTTHPHPAGAWALLEMTPEGFHLEIKGRDRAIFSLPFKQRGHHWLTR